MASKLQIALSFIVSVTCLFALLFIVPSWLQGWAMSSMEHQDSFQKPSSAEIELKDVLWMAPFTSGGGYSSEAISYVLAMAQSPSSRDRRLRIAQHGDGLNLEFWEGLDGGTKSVLEDLAGTEISPKRSIVVCHSEPGAWFPPLFDTPACPPRGYSRSRQAYVIGRTMFETDRVGKEHVKRCNKMDEVWVPSEFHIETFAKSGVQRSKLVKMVQAVDVDFFNPNKADNLPLPWGIQVFGPPESPSAHSISKESFVFLSIFKWEFRKGWDVLLQAYLQEFSANEDSVLYMLTKPYHSSGDFSSTMREYATKLGLGNLDNGTMSRVHVLDSYVEQSLLPSIYRAANVFVLPTRGEGWGRPIVEAMAMGLPVVATNWSGVTEYLTVENGYPLKVEKLSRVEGGPFEGHLWAESSVSELRRLMRLLFENREEGVLKGEKARKDMVEKFAPDVVAEKVANRFREIDLLLGGRSMDEEL